MWLKISICVVMIILNAPLHILFLCHLNTVSQNYKLHRTRIEKFRTYSQIVECGCFHSVVSCNRMDGARPASTNCETQPALYCMASVNHNKDGALLSNLCSTKVGDYFFFFCMRKFNAICNTKDNTINHIS